MFIYFIQHFSLLLLLMKYDHDHDIRQVLSTLNPNQHLVFLINNERKSFNDSKINKRCNFISNKVN